MDTPYCQRGKAKASKGEYVPPGTRAGSAQDTRPLPPSKAGKCKQGCMPDGGRVHPGTEEAEDPSKTSQCPVPTGGDTSPGPGGTPDSVPRAGLPPTYLTSTRPRAPGRGNASGSPASGPGHAQRPPRSWGGNRGTGITPRPGGNRAGSTARPRRGRPRDGTGPDPPARQQGKGSRAPQYRGRQCLPRGAAAAGPPLAPRNVAAVGGEDSAPAAPALRGLAHSGSPGPRRARPLPQRCAGHVDFAAAPGRGPPAPGRPTRSPGHHGSRAALLRSRRPHRPPSPRRAATHFRPTPSSAASPRPHHVTRGPIASRALTVSAVQWAPAPPRDARPARRCRPMNARGGGV